MRLTLLGIALVLAGAPLTGCISGEEPLDKGVTESATVGKAAADALQGENGTSAVPVDLEVPEWRVGDSWNVEQIGFGGGTCTLVVTAAGGSYTLSPTCEDIAQADAVFDISYVGQVRASDLAGAQQGQPVQFFAFPLTDGKTWTTTWDGIPISLKATFAPNLMAPGLGGAPGFTITGLTPEGEEYVKYDYSPLLKWWTHVDFVRDGYGMKITGFKENWTGAYKAGQAKLVYENAPPTPGFFVPGTFAVSEGQTSLVVMLAGGAGMGYGYALNLVDPAGGVAWQKQDAGQATSVFEFVTISTPAAGDWKAANAGSWNPQAGGFAFSVHEVAVADMVLGGS